MINGTFAADPTLQSTGMYPFLCSDLSETCDSIIYQNNDLTKEQISTFYSVNASQIMPVRHGSKENDLVTVPCSCKNVNGTVGYFYDTPYLVKPNDTFLAVSGEFYNGQAWPVGNEERTYVAGNNSTMHLLCGCVKKTTQIVVTYTVQPQDTLSDIATLLSAEVDEIQSSNSMLTQRPGYIDVGWVLFVPMYKNGIPPATEKSK